MREYLKKTPGEVKSLVYLAGDIASRMNLRIYLVGGFVRDLILGAKNLDLDIVVEGSGIKFAEKLALELKAKLTRHRRFGTATVILKSGLKIDIATARKEYYPEPAHLPCVSAGTLKDDLFRRDFTINAMAISISPEDFGQLIDFFGGRKDLNNKKIRILHNLSFIDDPTRILRAVRFEQRYNFKIEPRTLRALRGAVDSKILEKIEPQRVRDELILILKEQKPLLGLRRLKGLTGFSFIDSHLRLSKKTFSLLRSIEKEINWFNKVYHLRRLLDTWLIYFMGLVDSRNTRQLAGICHRFVFRKGEEKRILSFKRISHKFVLSLRRKRIKPSKIFSLLEPLSYEAILLLKAKYKNPVIQMHIEDFFEIYNGMRICISGEDLGRLGLPPGPKYKKIFVRVLNAKLDGIVKTREEELELIGALVKKR